jgi:hypothetical protein
MIYAGSKYLPLHPLKERSKFPKQLPGVLVNKKNYKHIVFAYQQPFHQLSKQKPANSNVKILRKPIAYLFYFLQLNGLFVPLKRLLHGTSL